MTLFCHLLSIFTNPGTIEEEKLKKLKKDEKTFCKKCEKYRPLRAHHCSTCNKCILKLDHHCPWIYNCVGYYNQKTFILFLFYGTIGDFTAFLCLIFRIFHPTFNYMIINAANDINFDDDYVFFKLILALKHPLWIIFGTVMSFGMTFGIGVLLYTQINNIRKNITSCECTIYDEDDECPYYCDNKDFRFFMFKTVMGMGNYWKWFFPIFEENKYNGGYYFDTPYKRVVKKKDNKDKKKERFCWKYCFCCPF